MAELIASCNVFVIVRHNFKMNEHNLLNICLINNYADSLLSVHVLWVHALKREPIESVFFHYSMFCMTRF